MQGDEKVIKSPSKRPRHVFLLNGVQQLLLVHIRTETVRRFKVGLITQRRIKCQRVVVEAKQKYETNTIIFKCSKLIEFKLYWVTFEPEEFLHFDKFKDINTSIFLRDVEGKHGHRIFAESTPSTKFG
jgi:hypothetical protein